MVFVFPNYIVISACTFADYFSIVQPCVTPRALIGAFVCPTRNGLSTAIHRAIAVSVLLLLSALKGEYSVTALHFGTCKCYFSWKIPWSALVGLPRPHKRCCLKLLPSNCILFAKMSRRFEDTLASVEMIPFALGRRQSPTVELECRMDPDPNKDAKLTLSA